MKKEQPGGFIEISPYKVIHRISKVVYTAIGKRLTIDCGENSDGTHTSLPAIIRYEDSNGALIEADPSNSSFERLVDDNNFEI